MTPDELVYQKKVQHYSASVNAWYNTQLEHDKSLLTLSAGAIGLLTTLLTARGTNSPEGLVLYLTSLACFVACALIVLAIFKQNGKIIEAIVHNKAPPPHAAILDALAIYTFAAGVILAAIIGGSAAISTYMKENSVAIEKKDSSSTAEFKESFQGAAKLVQGLENKSYTGAQNLLPRDSSTQPAATTQPVASQPGAANPAPQEQPISPATPGDNKSD